MVRKPTQEDLDHHRYLDRLKGQRDAASLQHGVQLAREAGLAEGREEGLGLGKIIGQILLCQRLLKQPLTPHEELLRLSVEELSQLANQLEGQLLPRSNGAD